MSGLGIICVALIVVLAAGILAVVISGCWEN